MFRKIATALAAGVLALSGLVAMSAPAQADSSATQCPPGFTWDAFNNAKKRGSLVDEYWLNNTAVVVYRVDNRHEVYVTDGFNVARACSDKKPDRPKDARDTQTPKPVGGGGGGGAAYAPGYGGPGFNLYPFPSENNGKVTVGPVESVS